MNDSVMTQLKVIVERAVRPIRAGKSRKRRMREELWGHLVGIYEEEVGRLGDEQAALEQAGQRFGDPRELTEELQGAVSKWDRVCPLFDELEFKPGASLLHLAGRHMLFALALFSVTLLVMLPITWIPGRLGEIGLLLHIILVMSIVMAAFSFVFAVFTERFRRALYGRESERSRRTAGVHCLASLAVFPAMTYLTYLGLLGDFTSGLSGLYVACALAPAAPVLFVVIARQVAEEMRHEEEWAKLEIEE